MEADQNPSPLEVVNGFILNQFNATMEALSLQQTKEANQAFLLAKNAFKSFDSSLATADELNALQVLVHLIQIASTTLKTNLFMQEERWVKAKEVTMEVLLLVEEAQSLADTPATANQIGSVVNNMTVFFLRYFEIILKNALLTINMTLDRTMGKIVSEVNVKKALLTNYRTIEDYVINPEGEQAQMMLTLQSILRQLGDNTEVQLEKLIERNSKIQFMAPIDNQLFLIHGHGLLYLRELQNLLHKQFEINPIVLIDEPNMGKTVIEKMEYFGMQCAFAFAIITPDDIVQKEGGDYFQARPNVLFELGWFIGRYGRERVRIIKKRGVELPSDFGGLMTLSFDNKVEEVFLKIQQELIDFGLLKS